MYFQLGLIFYLVSTAVNNIDPLGEDGPTSHVAWSSLVQDWWSMRSRYCLHCWPQRMLLLVINLVSRRIIYKLQYPKILTFLSVYVPNCESNCLVQSWHNLGLWINTCRCLTGIIFTSAQVSILACRKFVLFLCGLTLNSKFVNRCLSAGYIDISLYSLHLHLQAK